MIYKILSITMLAALVNCEPPVQGYNYRRPHYQNQNNFNPQTSYLPPNTGYNPPPSPPSNNYLPPTSFGNSRSGHSGIGHSGIVNGINSGHDYNQDYDQGHGQGHENEEPKAYEFGYSVKDAASGNDYNRRETSDGNVVRGEYRVQLPDGRTQIVTYHADWQTGFHADVRYEGEARYPEPTRNNYNNQGYNYNSPSSAPGDFSGSLTGFHGNGDSYQPSTAYGPPNYHK